MTIEEEIWDEFNTLSNEQSIFSFRDGLGFSNNDKIGIINRIDKPQQIWYSGRQVALDELIEKALRGEKKWDQISDDMPKRIVTELHEAQFVRINKGILSVFNAPDDAIDYLNVKRFSDGLKCVRCGSSRIYHLSEGIWKYKCPTCNYKFIPSTRTIFHNTKLDLTKWYAGLVMLTSQNRISVRRLADILKIQYVPAWQMCRKIKDNINDPFLREVNRGIFEYKPIRHV